MEYEDIKYAAEEGYVIQDEPGWNKTGYEIYYQRKFLGGTETFSAAVKSVAVHMDREKYWPDVLYVNERGNTDVLSIFRRGKGYSYRTVQSWV
jgi:hypothetical protein